MAGSDAVCDFPPSEPPGDALNTDGNFDAGGADWREAAAVVFGIDVAAEPDRAKAMHDSHLARARWMTEVGYAHLLGCKRPLTR